MAIKVGLFNAEYHSYHAEELNTDLSVVRTMALKRQRAGNAVVIHHHTADQACAGSEHEVYAEDGTITKVTPEFQLITTPLGLREK